MNAETKDKSTEKKHRFHQENKGKEKYKMGLNIFKRKKINKENEEPMKPEAAASVSEAGAETAGGLAEEDSAVETDVAAKVEAKSEETAEPAGENRSGFFDRLRRGLTKTREILTTDIDELFLCGKKIDDELLDDLEALLITSDMGVETTTTLVERFSKKAKKLEDPSKLKALLKEEILRLMRDMPPAPPMFEESPHVIMVVGVNGVGKTTTIGKLAARFESRGKRTLIAAADTFRAAAIEQLEIWAERSGADFVRGKDKSDPASVAFDAMNASISRGKDVVLIDTAGRLHTNVNLMEEVKKIKRAVAKKMPGAPHEILLVLDASTGQNAVSQANMFNEALGITGMALTKLDGTAKGGIVVSICNNLKIPLQYIGIGEKIEDLQDFDPEQFVKALF